MRRSLGLMALLAILVACSSSNPAPSERACGRFERLVQTVQKGNVPRATLVAELRAIRDAATRGHPGIYDAAEALAGEAERGTGEFFGPAGTLADACRAAGFPVSTPSP